MMKFKNLKYAVLLCLLIAFNSCGEDNSFEIIDENSVEELNVVTTKSGSTCDTQIALNYNFGPGISPSDKQAYKVWYRGAMSQFFTICSVQAFGNSCPDSEIWMVNGQEYYGNSYYPYNSPSFMIMLKGTTGGNGSGDGVFDPEAEPMFDANYDPDDCFKAKEDNLNNHLNGL